MLLKTEILLKPSWKILSIVLILLLVKEPVFAIQEDLREGQDSLFDPNKAISSNVLIGSVFDNLKYPTKSETDSSSLFIEKMTISFKDTLHYSLDSDMFWKLKGEKGETIKKGMGTISGIIFGESGNYILDFTQPKKFGSYFSSGLPAHNTCNHSPFPDRVDLFVSPIHLKFDFSTIRFSSPLSSGFIDEFHVSLEAWYDQLEGIEYSPELLIVRSSGVGADIKGVVVNGITSQKKGKIELTYSLEGSLQKDTYIMLDFIDVNNVIQSYTHLTKIK